MRSMRRVSTLRCGMVMPACCSDQPLPPIVCFRLWKGFLRNGIRQQQHRTGIVSRFINKMMALYVSFNSVYISVCISLPSIAKQQRKMDKFEADFRTSLLLRCALFLYQLSGLLTNYSCTDCTNRISSNNWKILE